MRFRDIQQGFCSASKLPAPPPDVRTSSLSHAGVAAGILGAEPSFSPAECTALEGQSLQRVTKALLCRAELGRREGDKVARNSAQIKGLGEEVQCFSGAANNDNGDAEEWRQVPSYPKYFASNLGRVRGPRKILSPGFKDDGYEQVCPYVPGKTQRFVSVHRLVAEAFLGRRPDGLEVDHVDGNKRNNRPENLQYVTHRENAIRAARMGKMSRPGIRGEAAKNAKLTSAKVLEILALRRDGVSHSEIARRFGIARSVSEMISLGRRWQHVTGIVYRPIGRGSRKLPTPASPSTRGAT